MSPEPLRPHDPPSDVDYRAQTTFLISRLQRILRNTIADGISDEGVVFAEFVLMNVVRIAGPITNAELARWTRVAPQSSFRLVSGLVNRGIFARVDAAGGLQPIVLTEQGREIHDRLLAVERSVLEQLSGADPTWLAALNAKLAEGLRNMDGDPTDAGRS